MSEGCPPLTDATTLISPKVLAVVYPAMDGRRQITVRAHKGETITRRRILGDRWAQPWRARRGAQRRPGVRFSVQTQVGTDFDLAHALKIDSRAIRAARNLATPQAKGETGWAPQLRELIAFGKIATVLGTDVAKLVGFARFASEAGAQ